MEEYFSLLLNSSCYNRKRSNVLHTLKCSDLSFARFTIADVINAIKSFKNGKATGLDYVYGKHFKYADDKIETLLIAIRFNATIIHDFFYQNTC